MSASVALPDHDNAAPAITPEPVLSEEIAMGGYDRKFRQRIVDEYLNATGANSFVPADFLEWLKPQEDHQIWGVFFGKDDAEAAHQYRLGLARSFVSGLRITVRVSETESVKVPAFISPIARRTEVDVDGEPSGGGYLSVDISHGPTMQELARQGANDLGRWLGRYGGTAKLLGVDISGAEALVMAMQAAAGAAVESEAA